MTLGPDAALAQEDRLCEVCHSDVARFDTIPRLIVLQETHLASVHGQDSVRCVDCHADMVGVFPSGDDEPPHPDEVEPAVCETCHEAESTEFALSTHGFALRRGNERAPACGDCHGTHDIRPSDDPESPTAKANIPTTCAECHGEEGMLTEEYVRLPAMAVSYARSVHGQGRLEGETETAGCDDCHGTHAIRGSQDPASPMNRLNLAATCGECHEEAAEEYVESIHGLALEAGLDDTPSCTDCHGEHVILHADDETAVTHAAHVAVETCAPCHDDPVIIAKYNLSGGVVGSYLDSYHGWATARDHGHSATCVSCHTAHLVLPAADSASSISPARIVATCQQCHEGATAEFAASYDHVAASQATNRGKRIVTVVYIALIVVVIGGMALHNALIMNYYLTEKRRREKKERGVVRFDRVQIAQHITLAVTFILLVITGFALRYPEALWVKWTGMAYLSEPVRSWTHRIAGVGLILFSVVHVLYILLSRRGRQEFRAMAPNLQDFRDFGDNMRYHTWSTDRKPRFGRYDYTQKAEYWALVWGTALMAITGLVLWFPVVATSWAPAWVVSISETIHFYEAWLATLAIVVWHFFFVMVHPEVYPMSWIWLTGKMPEHEIHAVHGRWYDEELADKLEELEPGETTVVP